MATDRMEFVVEGGVGSGTLNGTRGYRTVARDCQRELGMPG